MAVTEQALQLLQARYFLKDETGIPVEDEAALWQRLSKAIAAAEDTAKKRDQRQEEFYTYLSSQMFLPNSPTIMNAGKKGGQLSACQPAGSFVFMYDGLRRIENLGSSITRGYGEIESKITREVSELACVETDIFPPIYFTPDHEIRVGSNHNARIGTGSVITRKDVVLHQFGHHPKYFLPAGSLLRGDLLYVPLSKSSVPVKYADGVELTKEILVLSSWYVGNGWLGWYQTKSGRKPGTICIALRVGRDGQEIPESLQNAINFLGVHFSLEKNGRIVRIHSSKMARWLYAQFGKGALTKHIPGWLFDVSREDMEVFLDAYPDGWKVGDNRTWSSTNESLFCSLVVLNLMCGRRGHSSKVKRSKTEFPGTKANVWYFLWSKNTVRKHKVSDLRGASEPYAFARVKRVNLERCDTPVRVYNFETTSHLYNALVEVHNCFVVPVEDNIQAIFNAVKFAALIHKTGGGTGFSFSKLRPAGSIVNTTKGTASGPVSFMRVFDAATGAIKQGGVRRGANLGCLNVTHPDIREFVTCKQDLSSFSNFNISVGVTDVFMRAVESNGTYDLVDPFTHQRTAQDAREVWEIICQSIHKCGDPGILFLDEINRHNFAPWLGKIHTTNPCGEQPLHDWGSCNLGSIDVSRMLKGSQLDYDVLKDVTQMAVRYLDNVITLNSYPIVKIKNKAMLCRPIGLGIMGWADLLIRMGIDYDSAAALDLADDLMRHLLQYAREASKGLAEEKGPYPGKENGHARNATLTTIAPTGSLCIIANCSSGIEPLFSEEYTKKIMEGAINVEFKAPDSKGKKIKTAHDIPVSAHVRMQAAFQKHTDNAVSKTINLNAGAKVSQIADAIFMAYELKCKGITLFRDTSRQGVLTKKAVQSECDSDRCLI